MLIKLTNRCYEMCSHCMEDSCPSGDHMSWNVLRDLLSFIDFNKVNILVISGGELTTDPEFYEKVAYISKKANKCLMSLQSNGSFISDKDKVEKVKDLLTNYSNIMMMQVSTHEKYYPNYEYTMSKRSELESISPKLKFVEDWQGRLTNIHRLGRARNLTDEEFKGMPSCSTLLSRSHQLDKILGRDFKLGEFINFLEFSNHVCKPLVNEYGHVYVGECQFCIKAGDINGFKTMSLNDKTELCKSIMNKFATVPMCNKCGEVKNLKGKVPDKVIETGLFKI